jgi:NDP-sugar pyrophosphorylase family protein
MKVVILAGGLGTRLMEETEARPKPMVEIGGKPILWHIMKIYEHYGFWKFMDSLRGGIELEELLNSVKAKWKTW